MNEMIDMIKRSVEQSMLRGMTLMSIKLLLVDTGGEWLLHDNDGMR